MAVPSPLWCSIGHREYSVFDVSGQALINGLAYLVLLTAATPVNCIQLQLHLLRELAYVCWSASRTPAFLNILLVTGILSLGNFSTTRRLLLILNGVVKHIRSSSMDINEIE